VEAVLRRQPGIRQAVVVGRESPRGDKRLVAYLLRDSSAPLDTRSLRRALAAELPPYEIPALYQTVTRLPITANGKTDRDSLPEPVWEELRPS
jgi:nonribosomal peptide synthetase DhbF